MDSTSAGDPVAVDLGYLQRPSRWILVAPPITALFWAWLAFFLPRPYALLLLAGIGVYVMAIEVLVLFPNRRQFKLRADRVQFPIGSAPWRDVIDAKLPGDGFLYFTVVEHTLNMIDNVVLLPCPPEKAIEVEGFVRRVAPHVRWT